ncbi:MAG TPA: class I SAM-dependent methyltransferase [Candidatus Binatia bacterium]|nr:class I SAM-dependent methyltransferase [Candidatus Binatia bacterium]
MTDLLKYRERGEERARREDLLQLLPRGRRSVLDIGARDGYFSRPLTEYFEEVTALDLEKPRFEYPRVTTVAGDITRLTFPDSSFDCVFCAEVLEHIPALAEACSELARVARHEIVIGVPYREDIRVGRTTCRRCGKANPPWGHVNRFDEEHLERLFPGLEVRAKSFAGSNPWRTNPVSAMLMDWAGNPWGTYQQDEPCIHCGAALEASANGRSYVSRICSGMAARLNRLQMSCSQPHPYWIHLVYSKKPAQDSRVGNNGP